MSGVQQLLSIDEKIQSLNLPITTLRDNLLDPVLDSLVLNNSTITASGSTGNLSIRGAKHVDVLIYVGTATGTPSITFSLEIIEPTSDQVIRTYNGSSLTTEGADYITVDGLTLGTTTKVTYDGVLNGSNYFSGVYCRVVAKR
jgi:hypothetical protein